MPALNGRGVALDLLGQHVEAQRSYRTALAANPADIPTANNLALSLMLDGRAPEAVTILAALARRGGAPPRVAVNLGLAQAANGDRNAAQTTLSGRMASEDLDSLAVTIGTARSAAEAPGRS